MVDVGVLVRLGIYPWNYIKAEFEKADILMGNGFSINMSSRFRYDSLFEDFLGGCTDLEQEIFKSFDTSNFELIQHKLQSAVLVNRLFEYPTAEIEQMINKLRNGLIQAIERNHPRAAERDKVLLFSIARQLADYGDIYTLNYDLLLYHIIMMARNQIGLDVSGVFRRYNDYFWSARNGVLDFMDYQNYDYKHVYYLHGALFLFHNGYSIYKLKRTTDEELIDRVARHIAKGVMPLFVSEGTWQDKLSVINRNAYLAFAHNHFRNSSERLIIYGTSLSKEHDKHIIDSINHKPRHVAISIHTDGKSEETLHSQIYDYKSKLSSLHRSIVFYDASTFLDYSLAL